MPKMERGLQIIVRCKKADRFLKKQMGFPSCTGGPSIRLGDRIGADSGEICHKFLPRVLGCDSPGIATGNGGMC